MGASQGRFIDKIQLARLIQSELVVKQIVKLV